MEWRVALGCGERELPRDALKPVLSLLANELKMLPSWIKLVVTSRDEAQIKAALKGYTPSELRVDEARNRQDVRAYLTVLAKEHVELEVTMESLRHEVEAKFPGLKNLDTFADLEDPLGAHKLDQPAEEMRLRPRGLSLASRALRRSLSQPRLIRAAHPARTRLPPHRGKALRERPARPWPTCAAGPTITAATGITARLRPAALFSIGAFGLILPILAWYGMHGALDELYYQTVVFPFQVLGNVPHTTLPAPWPLIGQDAAIRAGIGNYFPSILATLWWYGKCELLYQTSKTDQSKGGT